MFWTILLLLLAVPVGVLFGMFMEWLDERRIR